MRGIVFQAHYRRQIEQSLATYRRLLEFVNAPPPNLAASKVLLTGLVDLLGIYTALKSQIPASSEWYRPRPEYESILASNDDAFVNIHLATATMPPPRTGHDYLWFEKAVAGLVADNIFLHVKFDDAIGAYEILNVVQFRLHSMAKRFAVEEALLLEQIISSRVMAAIAQPQDQTTDEPRSSEWSPSALKTQLCDFVAFSPMQILLGFATRISSIDPHALFDTVDWKKWFLKKQYYREELPRPLLVELDSIGSRLHFERSIEGRVITGDWYLREQYAVLLIRNVTRTLEPIAARIETAYHSAVERLVADKNNVAAMHVALRGLESCHKFDYHLDAIAKWCASARSAHVHDESAVALPDTQGLLQRIAAEEAKLLDAVQTLAFSVYDEAATRERVLPDYFGHAYMIVASILFERIRTNVADAQDLFRAFFGLSVLATQRIGGEVTNVDPTVRFAYITEPYVHLAELSGYAYLYSQLQADGRLWRSVKALWRNGFKEYLNEEALRLMFVEHLPIVRPWYASRFKWKRIFEEDIAAADASKQWFSPLLNIMREKILSWQGSEYIDARDVFYLVFLRQRPAFRDGEMPHGAQSLAYRAERVADASR